MSAPSFTWPEELFSSEETLSWLRSELGPEVNGPDRVLYAKQWGVTASYKGAGGQRLVLKASAHPAAAHGPTVSRYLAEIAPGRVPAVVAQRADGPRAWTVFEYLAGASLDEDPSRRRFSQLATVFASIQVDAVDGEIPRAIPRSPAWRLLETLERFADSTEAHLREWESEGTGPESLPAREARRALESVVELVASGVAQVSASGWPYSIDHVDLNLSNALLTEGGLAIIDWEEAVVGFPAFSLDRLLDEARDFDEWDAPLRSPTEVEVIRSYAEAIPWGRDDERMSVIDTAIRLNRVAFAGQALQFWRARSRPHGHPSLAAFCVDRILEAWAPADGLSTFAR